jgi:hypothetical protein
MLYRLNMSNLMLNTLKETSIRRLLVVVLVPDQRSTLTSENTWNPRVLVGNSPNSNTDAALYSKARSGNTLVRVSLDGEASIGGGRVQALVELSVDNIDTQISGRTKSSLKFRLRWCRTGRGGGCFG